MRTLALLLALLAGLALARKHPDRAAMSLLLGGSAVLAAATVLQLRFLNSSSPLFALVIGWVGADLSLRKDCS